MAKKSQQKPKSEDEIELGNLRLKLALSQSSEADVKRIKELEDKIDNFNYGKITK